MGQRPVSIAPGDPQGRVTDHQDRIRFPAGTAAVQLAALEMRADALFPEEQAQQGGCRGAVLVLTGGGLASTDVPPEVPRAARFEDAAEFVLEADQRTP